MPTKRDYDPVKRREYYLRTRQLKGRAKGSKEFITRYTKKGPGSDEIRRDEVAKANAARELLILSEKLKRIQESGNTDSPAYQKALQRYTNALNNYRKRYTNTAERVGKVGVDVGTHTVDGVSAAGRVGVNVGVNTAENVAAAGRASFNLGKDLVEAHVRAGRAVETTTTKSGKYVTKMVTKHGRRVLKTMTGL